MSDAHIGGPIAKVRGARVETAEANSWKKFGGAQKRGISPYTDTRPSSPIPPRGWRVPEMVVSRVKADSSSCCDPD